MRKLRKTSCMLDWSKSSGTSFGKSRFNRKIFKILQKCPFAREDYWCTQNSHDMCDMSLWGKLSLGAALARLDLVQCCLPSGPSSTLDSLSQLGSRILEYRGLGQSLSHMILLMINDQELTLANKDSCDKSRQEVKPTLARTLSYNLAIDVIYFKDNFQ